MDAQLSLPALIRRKRDGEQLRDEEIQSFVRSVTEGSAEQGQIGGGMAGPGGDTARECTGGTWNGTRGRQEGAGGGGMSLGRGQVGHGSSWGMVRDMARGRGGDRAWGDTPGDIPGEDTARGPGTGTRPKAAGTWQGWGDTGWGHTEGT